MYLPSSIRHGRETIRAAKLTVRDSLGGLIGVEYDAANRIRSITHKRDRFGYAYHRNELAAVHRPTGESLYFIYTDKGTVDEVIRRKR